MILDHSLLSAAAFAAACFLDWFLGDPRWMPHPVRFLGNAILVLEKRATAWFSSPAALVTAGCVIVFIVAGGAAFISALLLRTSYGLSFYAGLVFEGYIYYSLLAGGDLRNHVIRVSNALTRHDLGEARKMIAFLVSRDTDRLEESDISRAALESLFENSADGLVAPLFFLLVSGPVGAVFYKAVSTLDSMIGYKKEEYLYLGRCAAKLDDLLNIIPARLTALIILALGCSKARIIRTFSVIFSDHDKHESPNSAWPESAAAGNLGIRLGGPDCYSGIRVDHPVININGREPDLEALKFGISLYSRLAVTSYLISLLIFWLIRSMGVFIF